MKNKTIHRIYKTLINRDTGLVSIGKHDHDRLKKALENAYERGIQDYKGFMKHGEIELIEGFAHDKKNCESCKEFSE